jgi:exodeoxyribonuclease VII small subunit
MGLRLVFPYSQFPHSLFPNPGPTHTLDPMTQSATADPATLSFEESLAELEKIVAHLERGDVPLADSIRIYKRGAALKARCEGQLKDAQLEVDQIVMGPDGPRTEPAKIGQ